VFAGEVKGPPGDPDNPVLNTDATAAPANANSNCAFSGLNDFDGEGVELLNQTQTAADSFKLFGLPKGFPGKFGACKGGTNASREK
jgi:hypothetical protein